MSEVANGGGALVPTQISCHVFLHCLVYHRYFFFLAARHVSVARLLLDGDSVFV